MGSARKETRDFAHRIFRLKHRRRCGVVAARNFTGVGAVVPRWTSRSGRRCFAKSNKRHIAHRRRHDDIVIELNEMARDQMRCEVKLEIIRRNAFV